MRVPNATAWRKDVVAPKTNRDCCTAHYYCTSTSATFRCDQTGRIFSPAPFGFTGTGTGRARMTEETERPLSEAKRRDEEATVSVQILDTNRRERETPRLPLARAVRARTSNSPTLGAPPETKTVASPSRGHRQTRRTRPQKIRILSYKTELLRSAYLHFNSKGSHGQNEHVVEAQNGQVKVLIGQQVLAR